MSRRVLLGRVLATTGIMLLISLALVGCNSRDEPSTAAPRHPKGERPIWVGHGIYGVSVPDGFLRCPMASCEEELKEWTARVPCDKLAFIERLVACTPGAEPCPAEGYEWKPGSDDLSLPDARTKWAIEVVLGVKLPGAVDRNSSPADIRRLREQASLAVEGFRHGLMAAAVEHEVGPAEYARLRRTYFGRIPWGPWLSDSGVDPRVLGMDEFLMEWPPIGRKYEDLVSLIGIMGEPTQDFGEPGVYYSFDGGSTGYRYTFILRDGVIWSMRKIAF